MSITNTPRPPKKNIKHKPKNTNQSKPTPKKIKDKNLNPTES